MPLNERRPSLYLLSLPHPPLSCAKTRTMSKSPITPHNPPSVSISRRDSPQSQSQSRTSTDSWNSVKSSDIDAEMEWSQQHIALLVVTLDNLPSTLTPFNGSVPPNNLLDKIARSVRDSRGADWPHSIRSTRRMLLQLARQKNASPLKDVKEHPTIHTPNPDIELNPITPVNNSEAAVTTKYCNVTPSKSSRKPLYRKNSMDFIPPSSVSSNVNITRAATRLRRSERFFTVHPYASSRPSHSPSPPLTDRELSNSPVRPNAVSSSIPRLQRSSTSYGPLLTVTTALTPPPPQLFNQSTSAHPLSQCLTYNDDLALPVIVHRTSNPCIARIRPPESSTRPTSMGPTVFSSYHPPVVGNVSSQPHLKRLPSYGAVNQKAKAVAKEQKESAMVLVDTPPQVTVVSGGESSDEEERHRQKTVKRMKTLHRKPSYMGAELPLRKAPISDSLESLLIPAPSLCSTASLASFHSKASSTFEESKFSVSVLTASPEAADPSPRRTPVTTTVSQSPKQRTLRRVPAQKLRSSQDDTSPSSVSPSRPPLRPLTGLSRKISFGSVDVSRGAQSSTPNARSSSSENSSLPLSSPFEEKILRLTSPFKVKNRKGTKYLF